MSPAGLLKMSKIIEYLKETRNEFKYVNWPSRRATLNFTILVVAISVVVAYYLGVFDFVFTRVLNFFL